MDYGWRYARAVRTDVAYGDPQCAKYKVGVCDGHYSQIPAADGVCGPRAFFGRFCREAFGLPTWGATEPGHAAMTTWQPTGWEVLLGAGWSHAWWGARGGQDFVLETKAREDRATYQQVLRGSWAAVARGDAPVDGKKFGHGGTWTALMWSMQTMEVIKNPVQTPRAIGKSLVPTKVDALLAKYKTAAPAGKVTTAADGTITIPAAAYTSKAKTASVSAMQSAGPGQQILHGGCSSDVGPPCAAPETSAFAYEVTPTAAVSTHATHPPPDLDDLDDVLRQRLLVVAGDVLPHREHHHLAPEPRPAAVG